MDALPALGHQGASSRKHFSFQLINYVPIQNWRHPPEECSDMINNWKKLELTKAVTLESLVMSDNIAYCLGRDTFAACIFSLYNSAEYVLPQQVLFRAVTIADSYVSLTGPRIFETNLDLTQKSGSLAFDLELVAGVALSIAEKYENDGHASICLNWLVNRLQPTNTRAHSQLKGDLKYLERHILEILEWDIEQPTAVQFLWAMSIRDGIAARSILDVPAKTRRICGVACLLLDLTLFYLHFTQYQPSTIAAAALNFAQLICGQDPVVPAESIVQCDIAEVLHQILMCDGAPRIILEKYSKDPFPGIAPFVLQAYDHQKKSAPPDLDSLRRSLAKLGIFVESPPGGHGHGEDDPLGTPRPPYMERMSSPPIAARSLGAERWTSSGTTETIRSAHRTYSPCSLGLQREGTGVYNIASGTQASSTVCQVTYDELLEQTACSQRTSEESSSAGPSEHAHVSFGERRERTLSTGELIARAEHLNERELDLLNVELEKLGYYSKGETNFI